MEHDAFVLAAGFGTRMRPLTEVLPKPLVPVCGVPLLSWSLALCARHGLHRVIVNAHWLADRLEPWAGLHEGCEVRLSVEQPDILGTGGGLKRVRDQLAERFAVLNGDVLHDVDLTELVARIRPGGGALAVRPDAEQAERYGIVALDDSGTIVRLSSVAEAPVEGRVHDDTHFTGIHALDRAALDRVPDGFACIVRTAYAELVPQRRVGGMRYAGPWLDCGDPEAYLDTNLAVLRGEVRGAVDPFARAGFAARVDGTAAGDATLVAGATLDGPVWIGAGARIGRNAHLVECVIGPGAVVPDGAELRQCVVWDGVEAPVEARRVVAWRSGEPLEV